MKGKALALAGIAAAFLIAVLSGLGVGSGGLLVIWLTMVEGVDPIQARGMNLLFFVFSSSAALICHLRRRRLNLRLVLWLAGFAVLGTLAGVWISDYLDPRWLRKGFGIVLILSGLYTLFGKSVKGKQNRAAFPASAEKSKSKDFSEALKK